MLHLYDRNKNKIAPLTNVKNVRVEKELNGDSSLLFSYPITGTYYNEIVEESYIRTKENEYIVKEIHELDEWTEFKCLLNVEDLEGKPFEHFEMVNSKIENTINTALAGTGWIVGHCDVTKRRTVRKSMCSSWDIIQEARKVYRCDIVFDTLNKKVNIYNKLGEDKGVYFTDELNLRRLEIQRDSYNFCTRIIPIGKDGMTIKDVNNGKEYVENHQYSNKIITKYWEDNRYTVPENLRDDAIAKLEELSNPYISYKADVIDLANMSNEYNVLDYSLGDTITLMNKRFKVKEKQRIVKIVEWLYEPEKNTVEIANRTASFEDMQRNFEDTSDMVDSVTTSDGMIDDSKVDFNPIRQEFVTIIAQKADIVDLNAAVARIGTLEATKANITDLEAVNARIDNLYTEDLTAINAEITYLKGNVAEIDTILSKEIFVELAEVGKIVAGSSIIADGAIGDAQISSLTAGKIRSGTIDTSLVTVAGADGKLNITGNRLQVIHEGLERVALGDVNRDGSVYGLRVRGVDGETVLFDEKGITREGITEGSIDDSKVDDSANIQGHKLDINSVIREVNDVGTETIKGTRVQVGDRSLDVELSTLETSISDNAEEISHQMSQIQVLDKSIKLKVDNQEFNQYKSINDENITTINTQLSKNTSNIDILQEQILLKVEQTDIDRSISEIEIGGTNLLPDSKNVEVYSNDSSKYPITLIGLGDSIWGILPEDGNIISTYTNVYITDMEGEEITVSVEVMSPVERQVGLSQSEQITIPPNKWVRISRTLIPSSNNRRVSGIYSNNTFNPAEFLYYRKYKVEKGNKATDWSPAPEDVESEITAINTKVAEIDINLESITSRVSSTESEIININDEVSAIESRVSTAEQKITDSAIVNTVRTSTGYMSDLDGKANESDFRVAESIIAQHTDEIAQRITIDGLGSEIVQNANSVRIAVGKIGATNLIQFSNIDSRSKMIKDKYVYDGTIILETKALYDGASIKIPHIKPNTEYTLSFKYKKLDGTLLAFGGHTESTYSNNIATVDGQGDKPLSDSSSIFIADDTEVHEVVVKFTTGDTVNPNHLFYLQPNRSKDGPYVKIEITELQFEEGENVTAWKPYPGEGEGPGYLFTGDAATFKNTSLKIINENSYPVLEGTTDGMLKIMAQMTTGYERGYQLSIVGNMVSFDYAKANEGRHQVGYIAAGLNPFAASGDLEEGISLSHNYGRHISIGGITNQQRPYTYLVFDTENRLGYVPGFPTIFILNAAFNARTRFYGSMEVLNRINFTPERSSNPWIAPGGDWLNINAYNLALNGSSGSSPRVEIQASTGEIVHFWNTRINKDLNVVGRKNALQKTENYGERLLNSLETPEYHFQDRGSGKTDENGECYLYTDDIFDETVNADMQYHVEIQEYGEGTLRPIERNSRYFVVKGTPNLDFGWTLTAKRKGYEYDRLEQPNSLEGEEETNFDELVEDEEENQIDEELEEILYEDMTFDLADYVLSGGDNQ